MEESWTVALELTLIERGSHSESEKLYLIEHVFARHGLAFVSQEIARAIERIERLDFQVPEPEIQAVLYAVYSGPVGEYHRPRVLE